jgi:putative heme-binding domain-containing protein
MTQFLFAGLLALGVMATSNSAEPWADKRLPESAREGLILWLDAATQNAARQSLKLPPLTSQSPIDICYDASGRKWHLSQDQKDARPTFQLMGDAVAMRFDGTDDYLARKAEKRELKDLTLFVVSATYSDQGGFRAIFAGNESSKNDYTSGINFDLGPYYSNKVQMLNAEGPGFGGAANLLKQALDFGKFHRFVLACGNGPDGINLYVDGQLSGTRQRTKSTMRLDELTLGARRYSNEARPPFVQGFLDGDIAEVLLFDCVLTADQLRAIDKYLSDKYANAVPIPPAHVGPPGSKPLVAVKDPPPVQMLVPGFTVRELPVNLPNINNVRYRADGKLIALAYNGNIYLLSDSDGDGLEDKIELWYENKGSLISPIGMAVTPPGFKHGQGVIVAAKGKVVLIVDSNGEGKADKEIVVAEKWEPYPPEMQTHGVDALGVAIDKDGAVYFGLGCKSYVNGYMLDKDGKSHYDLKSERGTILKVSPDFKKREIVCTGIRFPVGMAFNSEGDLFCTDQEGATWLPNGNPFDELLHIQPGRHYGFPPRHPKHLPNVIDEPSTFDYSPQHQSTCGLCFNDPVNAGATFGPKSWAGDALITGYSRGKLYRTKLFKTASQYYAQNQLIACLNMLTVDCCLTPKGELVVACHSGAPDWGSGPNGKGKLFKIEYDNSLPMPLLVWAQSQTEVRVAFDRPLDPRHLVDLAKRAKIEYGKYVRAGDRFESLRPGYATVQMQMTAPRYELRVFSASVTPDRKTLLLNTAPHPEATNYALTLSGMGRPEKSSGNVLAQYPQIDLSYDLCGVQAEWKSADGKESWSGWLPHFDTTVSRAFTEGSDGHLELWNRRRSPNLQTGSLKMHSNLMLWNMLRPVVQPGSRLDHEFPAEQVTLAFSSNAGVAISGSEPRRAEDNFLRPIRIGEPRPDLCIDILASEDKLTTTYAELRSQESIPGVQETLDKMFFRTTEDVRLRPLPLHRFLLPWATLKRSTNENTIRDIPELKGGNWARGKAVYFGNDSQCSKCHRVRGDGGDIGPDLSNLIHRDYDSVLRDIRFPSAAINPDHLTYLVELKDGRSFTGIIKQQGGQMRIVDSGAKETTIRTADVESISPSTISTMPEGLDKAIGPDKLRDLLTFLLTEPLTPAPLEIPGEPPPRKRAELEAVLKATTMPEGPFKKLNIVLCTGPKDHGPGEHDYPLWRRRWVKLFDLADNVVVSEADNWPKPEQMAKADLIVFYSNNPAWNADRAKELDAFLKRGGGAVFIHYAVDGHKDVDALASLIGLAWRGGASKFRHGPLDLSLGQHAITKGLEKVKLIDESYWNLTGDPKNVTVLASGREDGAAQPLIWVREHGKGRVFVSVPGHYTWSFDDPLFRLLLLRGMAWSAHEPVDRFRSLIWPGARLAIGE